MTATLERPDQAPDDMEQPPFTDYLDLAATPTAVPCARMFVEATLLRWRAASGVIYNNVKVSTEIFTKAVKASEEVDLIRISLIGLSASIVIGVCDSDPYPPDLPDDATGRCKFGSYPVDRGKVVWAELPAYPHTAHGLPCRSHKPTPHHRTLHSAELLRRIRDGLSGV